MTADLAGADARGCDFWEIDIPEGAKIKGLVIEQWQIPFPLRALGLSYRQIARGLRIGKATAWYLLRQAQEYPETPSEKAQEPRLWDVG